MTVKELIEKLQKLDPELLVVHDAGDADVEVRWVTLGKFLRKYAHWDFGVVGENGEDCVYIE